MQTIIHTRFMMKLVFILIIIMLFHLPAYGNPQQFEKKIHETSLLKKDPQSSPFSLLPPSCRKNLSFLLAEGFVLCEFITHQNSKLNICYRKKDVSSQPLLDMKRLFLEFSLDF